MTDFFRPFRRFTLTGIEGINKYERARVEVLLRRVARIEYVVAERRCGVQSAMFYRRERSSILWALERLGVVVREPDDREREEAA